MFELDKPWKPELNWATPAGQLLKRFFTSLAGFPRNDLLINVFGSAPLQMGIEESFLSNDVDIAVRVEEQSRVEDIIRDSRLGRDQTEYFIQCCPEGAFRTSLRWKDRAFHYPFSKGIARFAHPIDILIGKLNRADEKDIKAFELVMSRTGHPNEEELIAELQAAVELFSLAHIAGFNAPSYGDNVRKIWPRLFQREIDVDAEITGPAYSRIQESYEVPKLNAELSKVRPRYQ